MPELAEVEIARRHLTSWTAGATVVALAVDDPAVWTGGDPAALEGAVLSEWRRVGKQLVATIGDLRLLSHLGMTGRWQPAQAARHVRVRLVTQRDDARSDVVYCDARRFGELGLVGPNDAARRLERLGPDAWDAPLDAAALAAALARTRRPLKVALMDQSILAGLGNIAVIEVAYRARLHPHVPANTLSELDCARLLAAIQAHLAMLLDLDDGVPITYVSEGGPSPFRVYGRRDEPCPSCGTRFVGETLGGRPSVWCPACQRL